jgi:hypothetical protein
MGSKRTLDEFDLSVKRRKLGEENSFFEPPKPKYYVKTTLVKENKNHEKNKPESHKYISTKLIETEKVLIEASGCHPTIKKIAENTFSIIVDNLKAKEKLLNTTQITMNSTKYKLKSEENVKFSQVRGTVRASSLLLETDEELLAYLSDQKVVKIERMKKFENGILKDTGTFILTFSKNILPFKVVIAWETLHVRQYYDKPMQCKNCFGLGHTKKRCTKNSRCSRCGQENHQSNSCDQQLKCVNCNLSHAATSRDCYQIQRESSIIKTATDLKISFKEARQQLSEFEKSQISGFSTTLKQTENQNDIRKKTENFKLSLSTKERLKKAQSMAHENKNIPTEKPLTSQTTTATNNSLTSSRVPTTKDTVRSLKPPVKDNMDYEDDSEDEDT